MKYHSLLFLTISCQKVEYLIIFSIFTLTNCVILLIFLNDNLPFKPASRF